MSQCTCGSPGPIYGHASSCALLQPPAEPTITHTVSEDGLTLVSRWDGHPKGILTSTMGWKDLETADAYREQAKRLFEQRVASFGLVEVGEKRDIRRFETPVGTFFLHVNTGPPTWWLPNFAIKRKRSETDPTRWLVRAGWLRGCFILSWRPGGNH